MNEYIELLTKIKDMLVSPSVTDGFVEMIRNTFVAGVLLALTSGMVFVLLEEVNKVNKFLATIQGVSAFIFIVGLVTTIVSMMSMSLHGSSQLNELSNESKVVVSNYVSEMNDQDYSRLEKLVKLHGNNLTNNDETIKQINKYLMETVGK